MQKQLMIKTAARPIMAIYSWWLLALVTAALLGAASVHAADDDDPASRVARLSYLKGDVYVQPSEDGDRTTGTDSWIDAQLNRPLTSGDGLTTDSNARAELQMGDANMQVEEETRFHLLSLTDARTQVQLDQGSLNVYLRNANDQVDVITNNARIVLRQAGTYRVSAWDDDATQVQVRDGRAEVSRERQSYPVRNGEQLTLRGTTRLSVEYDDVPRMDEFDRWAATRNDRPARVASARYVDSSVIGYEDLDDYGDWRYVDDYGYVWMPTRISAGWAPYRFGHWLWVAPWGWTWVDDAPWGFAPFHYGRWAQVNDRWCWVPGPRTLRAVYAPALVAWVGTPSMSVSISVGANVGWIPLGPRDVYRPIYHSSERYVRNINLSNSRLNESEFERDYRRQPRELNYSNRVAATVISARAFQQAKPVQGNVVKTDPSRLTVNGSAPDIRADRTSRWGTGREHSLPDTHRAPDANTNTRFITPDATPRTRSAINTPYVRPDRDSRTETPNNPPAANNPQPQRNTPTFARPALPDVVRPEVNRGNVSNDQRGNSRSNDRNNAGGNSTENATPRNNEWREHRAQPIQPVQKIPSTPAVATPQPAAPASDIGKGNDQKDRRRGRGEEDIR